MISIRIRPGALTTEAFDVLRAAASGATLEAEPLEDGSLLITLDQDGATERLLRETIKTRQIRAKEALFDGIERTFGAAVASTLWTTQPFAAVLQSEEPLTAEQTVRLLAAAEQLANGDPCQEANAPPSENSSPPSRRRLRLVCSNEDVVADGKVAKS